MAVTLSEKAAKHVSSYLVKRGTVSYTHLDVYKRQTYFALDDVDGETLVSHLDRAGFAVASGAACSSANPEPSHVLRAMGVAPELARGAVRVSLGAASTAEQVSDFLRILQITVSKLLRLTAVAV